MKKIFIEGVIGVFLITLLSLGCIGTSTQPSTTQPSPQSTTAAVPSTTIPIQTTTPASTISAPTTFPPSTAPMPTLEGMENDVKIIFLHHSTGGYIWNGGVEEWFETYNTMEGVSYQIHEREYPANGYPWENYPCDYWNIWIDHAGNTQYIGQDTLEILTEDYNVVVWKHCFPVSCIEADTGNPDIRSSRKSIENYKLQYNALKEKMRQFPNTRFIVWTGAALVRDETSKEDAQRARQFFNWVKEEWDEKGDNIYIWDFYELETEGGLYFKDEYASGDSHPNPVFSQRVAPYFCQRMVDVVEGWGDNSSIEGR